MIVLTIFILYIKRNLFNPACITCLVWCVVIILYQTTSHGLCELSLLFFETVFFWCLFFCIGCLCTSNSKFCINATLSKVPKINKKKGYILLILLLTVSLCIIFIGAKKSGISSVGYVRNIGLNSEIVPFNVKVVNFITTLIYPLIFLFLDTDLKKSKKIFLFSLFLILSVLSGSKSQVMQIFITCLFLISYHKKIKISFLILMVAVLVGAFFIITLLRDNGNSKIDFLELIYIYFFSPLPAFDLLLNNKISADATPFAGTVLGLFYRIAAKFFGTAVPDSGLGFVFVPVPTNVYTIMLTGYVDFGRNGMFVFSLIYGMLWGYFYSFVKQNNKFYKLLYACFLNVLILQFFADYLFPYLAIFIYQIFITIFVYYKSKIKDFKFLRYQGNHD